MEIQPAISFTHILINILASASPLQLFGGVGILLLILLVVLMAG